jgi:hypothetical protein
VSENATIRGEVFGGTRDIDSSKYVDNRYTKKSATFFGAAVSGMIAGAEQWEGKGRLAVERRDVDYITGGKDYLGISLQLYYARRLAGRLWLESSYSGRYGTASVNGNSAGSAIHDIRVGVRMYD